MCNRVGNSGASKRGNETQGRHRAVGSALMKNNNPVILRHNQVKIVAENPAI